MHSTFQNHRNRFAAAIARDLLAERKQQKPAPTCLACGRSYHRGDGRFCSQRCRSSFDAGAPAYEARIPARLYSLPLGRNGFLIHCAAGCGQQFDSTGLKYCTPECGRRDREWRENAELMAEAGMERPAKRKCESCGGDIPNWQPNGRRMSRATRFCSKRCGKKARKLSGSPTAVLGLETAKLCPQIGARRGGAP